MGDIIDALFWYSFVAGDTSGTSGATGSGGCKGGAVVSDVWRLETACVGVTRGVCLCDGSVPRLKAVFIGADAVEVVCALCETLSEDGIRGVFISYGVPREGAARINPWPHGVRENTMPIKLSTCAMNRSAVMGAAYTSGCLYLPIPTDGEPSFEGN